MSEHFARCTRRCRTGDSARVSRCARIADRYRLGGGAQACAPKCREVLQLRVDLRVVPSEYLLKKSKNRFVMLRVSLHRKVKSNAIRSIRGKTNSVRK